MSAYLLTFLTLVFGILCGYLLVTEFPSNKMITAPLPSGKTKTSVVTLPPDAVIISSCSLHQGALYVKPSDIPIGPMYMVNNGKVIGLEFMLDRSQFLAGQSFDFLRGLGMKVDHINVGYLEHGHAGHNTPHYHVDLYNISREEEQAITCPGSQDSEKMMDMGSSSATMDNPPSKILSGTPSPISSVTAMPSDMRMP